MKLPFVFASGIGFSVALIGTCFWFFAWQAAGRKQFWLAGLSPDLYFSVTRNAVTLAAALGIGVTLFFSYRKQQTAEKAQELAVAAQRTATKAQKLATRTLQLSLDKHELDRVTELRSRYARSAEQLASDKTAIKLAGLHSLAALADDWMEIGNQGEKQVCVSLICSFIRSARLPEETGEQMVLQTATEIPLERLKEQYLGTTRSWSDCKIDLSQSRVNSMLSNMVIAGGSLTMLESRFSPTRIIKRLRLEDGYLSIQGNHSLRRFPSFAYSHFSGGTAHLRTEFNGTSTALNFRFCQFRGSAVFLTVSSEEKATVVFTGCHFMAGKVSVSARENPVAVRFVNCTFTSKEVVYLRGFLDARIDATFKNCRFLDAAADASQEEVVNSSHVDGVRV